MSLAGGSSPAVAGLSREQLGALERLLAIGAELQGLPFEAERARGESISTLACILGGVMPASSSLTVLEHSVALIETCEVLPGRWDCKVEAPRERLIVHFSYSRTRSTAVVNGLVLLAQTMLDAEDGRTGSSPPTTPESALSDALEEALQSYEENVDSVEEALREQNDGADEGTDEGADEGDDAQRASGGES